MPTRIVRGPGFTFSAPAGWRVSRALDAVSLAPEAAPRTLVAVWTFPLRKRYDPGEFDAAAHELDRVAADLVARSHARLTGSATVTVDGGRVRAYRFSARAAGGAGYDARIGFVLRGRREYQLYCQDAAGRGDVDGACALLFDTFSAT